MLREVVVVVVVTKAAGRVDGAKAEAAHANETRVTVRTENFCREYDT